MVKYFYELDIVEEDAILEWLTVESESEEESEEESEGESEEEEESEDE